MSFHINRNKNLIKWLENKGWRQASPDEYSDFSYWDIHKEPDINSKLKVWPKKGLSEMVDCLWTWHKRLEKLGLTHLAPHTIMDWEKYRLTEDDFKDNKLWFLKQVFGVHGKGINLLSTYDNYLNIFSIQPIPKQIQGPCFMEDLKHLYILQEGLTNTRLLKGRKFILRVYSLTMGTGETYLYNDCLYYSAIFPVKYDYQDCYVSKKKGKKKNKVYPLSVKNTKDKIFVPKKQMRKNVNVSHWKSDEEGEYNIVDDRLMGLLSELPIYKTVIRNLFQNIREMSLLFSDILNEYNDCINKPFPADLTKIYQIWGSDYMVMEDLSVKCLEINAFPNLTHGNPHKGKEGAKKRPHELKFRRQGFDRDLMRLFGYNFENRKEPNNWVLVNHEAMNTPIHQLNIQKQKQKKTKRTNKRRKKSKK